MSVISNNYFTFFSWMQICSAEILRKILASWILIVKETSLNNLHCWCLLLGHFSRFGKWKFSGSCLQRKLQELSLQSTIHRRFSSSPFVFIKNVLFIHFYEDSENIDSLDQLWFSILILLYLCCNETQFDDYL